MSDNAATIERLYRALQERDHETMASCYHPDVHFSDPVFTDLHGIEVAAMWHMLCERGTDLEVEFRDVEADGDHGSAHWDARYSFGPDGRPIYNSIDATFEFEDGKIIRHVDDFNLWRWTQQALGFSGLLLGWTGFSKTRVQATARRSLAKFMELHPEYDAEE
ncbi:MAG: nuclear transport factor 2 family protein [Acidimicrobiia bacterium]|nr:nuclear transport factor 2 family protein [Acidimicrobiia bacterium]